MPGTLRNMIRAGINLAVWILGVYVLNRFEFLSGFNTIDNVIGMIPVALALTGLVLITVLLWMPRKKETLPVLAAMIALVVLSIALFPGALLGNWWINTITRDEGEAAPDLSVYIPFSVDSKTAKLNEEPSLRLASDLPVLDGATALYPVYAAFAEAVYDKSAFSADDVLCTNTVNAYEALIAGERDIIFAANASEKQRAAAKIAGADLRFTPIGREAFVFLTGKNNPVADISYQQIRNIYSGKTAYWKTLGWREGGKIIAFQRPEGSGSQTGLQAIMGTIPIQVPQPLPGAELIGTNSLTRQVSVSWNGVEPAIGYSYRYFAAVMYANPAAKFLRVNGVEPSPENIQNGSYPFTANFYAVTNGEPEGGAKLLVEWILSKQGQALIQKTGYTPIAPACNISP